MSPLVDGKDLCLYSLIQNPLKAVEGLWLGWPLVQVFVPGLCSLAFFQELQNKSQFLHLFQLSTERKKPNLDYYTSELSWVRKRWILFSSCVCSIASACSSSAAGAVGLTLVLRSGTCTLWILCSVWGTNSLCRAAVLLEGLDFNHCAWPVSHSKLHLCKTAITVILSKCQCCIVFSMIPLGSFTWRGCDF